MTKTILSIIFSLLLWQVFAQTGSLQIYADKGVSIYINNKLKGKTTETESGYIIENIETGIVELKCVKANFTPSIQNIEIKANEITEVTIQLEKTNSSKTNSFGFDTHFGTFGLFNVNNTFTKAAYTFGATPYINFGINQNISIGGEVMFLWGKPQTKDSPRLIINPNVRFSFIFDLAKNLLLDVQIASGFSLWPENEEIPSLTPTFNQTRYGWDFRASAGLGYLISKKVLLHLNFGYMASSSSSDDITWITHDSMIISFGPRFLF